MDFKPTRNTLIINYLVTFGIVGIMLYASTRNYGYLSYYYSPEFNSHISNANSYGEAKGALDCNSCHTSHWKASTEQNCWVSGCHTNFERGKQVTPELLSLTQDEFGTTTPHYGALAAFHGKLNETVKCEMCHPSHRLPLKGAFNATTILVALGAKGDIPTDEKVLASRRADIFHREAKKFIGEVSCQTCHIDLNENEAARLKSASMVGSSTPATASGSEKASSPLPLNPVRGDVSQWQPIGTPAVANGAGSSADAGSSSPADAAKAAHPGTSPTPKPGEEKVPNLFKEADKENRSRGLIDDGAVEMPN